MKVAQSAKLARNATSSVLVSPWHRPCPFIDLPRQTSIYRRVHVVLVHVFIGGCWRSLPEINELVRSIRASHQHEASTTNARMVHACDRLERSCHEGQPMRGLTDQPDTEDGAHQLLRTRRISALKCVPMQRKGCGWYGGRKTASLTASAAFPPARSKSMPMRLHTAFSEATAPNLSATSDGR